MLVLINISNQELASEFFNQSLTKEHLARAYLLTGRALKDKLELVRQINLVLNCQVNKSGGLSAPCMQCTNCKWIATNTHPKTPLFLKTNLELALEEEGADEEAEASAKARKKGVVTVEAVRAMQELLIQNSEFFRIVIIKDANYNVLHRPAAVALLKTIEEAKPNTMFMLFSDSRDTVLNTIISRSQVVNFNNTEVKEYDEPELQLYNDLKSWLESGSASSRLQQIIEAEKLSESEFATLLGMLELMQDEYARDCTEFYKADMILRLETAIMDIKNFMRPKAVIGQLFKDLSYSTLAR